MDERLEVSTEVTIFVAGLLDSSWRATTDLFF
jgi:hypothetical protein